MIRAYLLPLEVTSKTPGPEREALSENNATVFANYRPVSNIPFHIKHPDGYQSWFQFHQSIDTAQSSAAYK